MKTCKDFNLELCAFCKVSGTICDIEYYTNVVSGAIRGNDLNTIKVYINNYYLPFIIQNLSEKARNKLEKIMLLV